MQRLTEKDVFESTDVTTNESETFKYTVVLNLYEALRLLLVDIFDERYYEPYFVPQSFRLVHKKKLQSLVKDFDYAMLQNKDRSFLMRVFNGYADFAGLGATRLLLDWMRNATDSDASHSCSLLSYVNSGIKRKELKLLSPLPLRLERFFSFLNLLTETFRGGEVTWQELGPDWFETPFDLDFYKRQEYDYYGEREITFDPSNDASGFSRTLLAKVAWENTCQGDPPTKEEMTEISEWMALHENYWRTEQNKMQFLFISPLLKEDFLRRRIIVPPQTK